jgi:hypothetical protein
VAQDPQSFAVGDVDQVPSIIHNGRMLLTASKVWSVRGFADHLAHAGLRTGWDCYQYCHQCPHPPSLLPSRAQVHSGAPSGHASGASAMASPAPTICNCSPDGLFGKFTRLTTFARNGLVTSTIVRPCSEACWMYRYCLLPCPWRKIWLTAAPGRSRWATTVAESAGFSGLCFAIALGTIAAKSKKRY